MHRCEMGWGGMEYKLCDRIRYKLWGVMFYKLCDVIKLCQRVM